MTDEMAKRYLTAIRGRVKTTTKKAIALRDVGDVCCHVVLGNQALFGGTSCAGPRHRWEHPGTGASEVLSPLWLQVWGEMEPVTCHRRRGVSACWMATRVWQMTDPMHPPWLKHLSSSMCRGALVLCVKVSISTNHPCRYTLINLDECPARAVPSQERICGRPSPIPFSTRLSLQVYKYIGEEPYLKVIKASARTEAAVSREVHARITCPTLIHVWIPTPCRTAPCVLHAIAAG